MGTQAAQTGWFISQDVGPAGEYLPAGQQKLFRLKGRGHGEWLQRNCKVSIANLRASTAPSINEYGSFSVIIRSISDTDNAVIVMERFDNLNLDPYYSLGLRPDKIFFLVNSGI